MMEIKGELEVTFKVKDAGDMQWLMMFCQEFEGVPVVRQPKRGHASAPGNRPSKKESQDAIIKLLKETYPREGFTMADAVATVFDKLALRETTTKHSITRAKKEGILLRRKHLCVDGGYSATSDRKTETTTTARASKGADDSRGTSGKYVINGNLPFFQ